MARKYAGPAVGIAAVLLAACAGGYRAGTPSGNTLTLPGTPDLRVTATLPHGSPLHHRHGKVRIELPGEGLGAVDDPYWKTTLAGYTQQQYSQALGFPPGTKLTITNISKSVQHTLNVVKKIKGPPAKFPSNPTLSQSASGGKLRKGYASGVIKPGQSVTVTLGKPGIYLIGCAFHYHSGMRDVLVVGKGATPGPQATAPPR